MKDTSLLEPSELWYLQQQSWNVLVMYRMQTLESAGIVDIRISPIDIINIMFIGNIVYWQYTFYINMGLEICVW